MNSWINLFIIIACIVAAIVFIVCVVRVVCSKTSKKSNNNIPQDKTEPDDNISPDKTNSNISKPYPIEKVREYFRRDFENQGYEDAKDNSDSKYIKQGIDKIKDEGIRTCKEAISDYEKEKINCKRCSEKFTKEGCLDSAEEIDAIKEIYESHIKEIKSMEDELKAKDDLGIYISYNKGYARWQRAIIKGLTNVYS